MSAAFADPLAHSAWIKAHPDRWYRITPSGKSIGCGIAWVEIMHVGGSRRSWSMSNIYMRPEIPDTDEGAVVALREHDLIVRTLMMQARGGTKHIIELLAMLRGEILTGVQ